jgi:hypothetical protein
MFGKNGLKTAADSHPLLESFSMPLLSQIMNAAPSTVPAFSTLCRSLLIAGATVILAASCTTAPESGAPNVFVSGQPTSRFGYGSNQPGPASQQGSASQPVKERPSQSDSGNRKISQSKIKSIKRDPSDTTLDLTPPEPSSDDKNNADTAGCPPATAPDVR